MFYCSFNASLKTFKLFVLLIRFVRQIMPLIEINTGTITEKGQIVIPKSIRERFSSGEKVAIISYEDRIELRPISSVNEALSCAYSAEKTLKKDWDSKEEDEAWKNL